jgi:phospholipid transport system substrate-binding protein
MAIVVSIGTLARAAVSQESPDAFIRTLGDEVIGILVDKSLSQPQRETKFHDMLVEYVDTETVSRTVLGRYWNSASSEERAEFQKLYREYLIRIYAARFTKLSGEKFVVKGSRPESGDIQLVSSTIEPPNGGPAYVVNWRVRSAGGNIRVVDVMAEGVSILVTHNQEFASVIQNRGGKVAGLLAELRKRVGPAR